ncbi:MAG: metal ABC transporter ATP-binding protein [Alphaproteobacteria bacterium]
MKKFITTVALCALLAGCASSPDKIAASSVSTLQYDGYSCRQIAAELARVERKVNELYYSLDKAAGNDSAQMAVGLILFWPALFFLEGGDGPQAAEYSRLKGELEALETVSIRKNCGIKFPEPPKRKEPATKPRNTFQQ